MALNNDTIVSFDSVSFEYEHDKPLLKEASFSVRRGTKITFMGQNGAGKSTILKLISGVIRPESGSVNVVPRLTIGTAHQVIKREDSELTVEDFFQKCFIKKYKLIYFISRCSYYRFTCFGYTLRHYPDVAFLGSIIKSNSRLAVGISSDVGLPMYSV